MDKLLRNFAFSYLIPILEIRMSFGKFCFLIQSHLLSSIAIFLKNHFKSQYKILSCISGSDHPEKLLRFAVTYELLSLKYNNRLRLRIVVDELTPVDSIESIYLGAYWWECEIWDMFGVYFLGEKQMIRLLTDYGFIGYPLRKDFPLSGFFESKYSLIKNRIIYENLELAQEYRAFNYSSPWNTTTQINLVN